MEPMEKKDALIRVKKMIPELGKSIFILFGIAIALIIYLSSAIVSISPGEIGVVFTKIGDDPAVKNRFIVEKGEKGIQRADCPTSQETCAEATAQTFRDAAGIRL